MADEPSPVDPADPAAPEAPRGRDLGAMRAEIDALDRALLELVGRRRALVAELFAYKRRLGLALIDEAREQDLLADRRAYAARAGVPEDVAEAIIRAILDASHAQAAADD